MKYKINIYPLIILAIINSGCEKQFRTALFECNYTNPGDCSTNTIQNNTEDYMLSFIEYNDQGQLFERKQLGTVLDTYWRIAKKQPIILVIFVHGWHHNANGDQWKPFDHDPDDDNISNFRTILSDLSKNENKNKNPRKILGVYIGWQGESIPIELVNLLTFWDRKSVANKISQQGITETLLKLEEIVDYSKSDINYDSHLITIGHSFGGAAVYTALQQIFVDRLLDSKRNIDDQTKEIEVEGFGDLVVLLNPAFEASRFTTLYDISQEHCPKYSQKQIPTLAIITSEADWATRFAFPFGRLFSTSLDSHMVLKDRNYCSNNESIPEEINEFVTDIKTVGHYEPYITHKLYKGSPHIKKMDHNNNAWQEENEKPWSAQMQDGQIEFDDNLILKHLGKTNLSNPYLNIKTDSDFISDHNDIWKPEISNFIKELIIKYADKKQINRDFLNRKHASNSNIIKTNQ